MKITSSVRVLCSFAALVCVPVKAQTYRAVPLGPLVPGTPTFRAMNNAGQIVGDFIPAGAPNRHAYIFSYPAGTLTDLGDLGGGFSSAYGISNNGKVTGLSSTASPTVTHAFVWANGVLTDIGTDPSAGASVGFAINDSGQVTGAFKITDSPSVRKRHAFLYSNGVMTDLATGQPYSQGNALNNAGDVAGDFGAYGGTHPFIYQSGVLMDLNPGLPFGGGNAGAGRAFAINDAGDVVGSLFTPNLKAVHAFLYSDGMTDLDLPPPPGQCCGSYDQAVSINNPGQILLRLNDVDYLYAGGVRTRLDSLIDPTAPLTGRIDPVNPIAINDNGWILGGDGKRAYLLIPQTLKLAPTLLDFGNQVIGTVSAAKTVTLTNSGTAGVPITSVTAPAPFVATNNCAASLDPSASCTIDVTFHPTGVDTRNGTLTINEGGQEHLVALSGTGTFSVTVTSSASSVAVGASFTLTWSTQTQDATCQASGGSAADQWNGSLAPSGSKSISEGATGTYTYTVRCDQGTSAQGQAVVTVTPAPASSSSSGGGGEIDLLSIAALLGVSGLCVARRQPTPLQPKM